MATTSNLERRTLHLLLRYSDRLRGVDTVGEHVGILSGLGRVWWGKFGQGVAASVVQKLLRQCESGVPTFAFLAEGKAIKFRGTVAEVLGGSRAPFRQPDASAVPAYYRAEKCRFWLKFSEIVSVSHSDVFPALSRYNSPIPERPDLNSSQGLIYVTTAVSRQALRSAPPANRSAELLEHEDFDAISDDDLNFR